MKATTDVKQREQRGQNSGEKKLQNKGNITGFYTEDEPRSDFRDFQDKGSVCKETVVVDCINAKLIIIDALYLPFHHVPPSCT